MLERAYAVLTVKALAPQVRQIRGLATAPTPDRAGDVFEPLGATWRNPVPLLLHHNPREIVGTATIEPATAAGLFFTAVLPAIDTPGPLQTRIETTLQELAAGLLWGVSLGFRPLADGLRLLANGARHFLKTEIVEISLTPIPTHRDATVLTVKSLFGGSTMLSDQITGLETRRGVPVARLSELTAAGLEAPEARAEFDRLELEVRSFDEQLTRLRRAEEIQAHRATPIITPAIVTPHTPQIIGPTPVIEKGTAFVRYCMALAAGRGDTMQAIARAAEWRDSTPEVELVLKAAVAPATTSDSAWAKPLVPLAKMTGDFIALLMPQTIIGKLKGLFRVPFNTQIPVELTGGSAYWVGENKIKPLTKFQYASAALPEYKVAAIVTLTEELARNSSPSAEAVFRRRLTNVISQFLDAQFIDPAITETAGVRPGSITNGVTPIVATAVPDNDLAALLMPFTTNLIPLSEVTIILSEANAFSLSMQKDALGNDLFPDIGPSGGEIFGVSAVVSQTAGGNVIAVAPGLVLYADEGGTVIDISREASLQMSDTPVDPADATAVYVSLWQANLIGLRAERHIAWKRTMLTAVQMLSGAAWAPTLAAAAPEGGTQRTRK